MFFHRIRYFDVCILIPNLIFLLFLVIKWIRTRTKLNLNKPLLLSVTCLLLLITLTNILRCLFVMIFPDQEIIVKVIKRFNIFYFEKRKSFFSLDSLVNYLVYIFMDRIKYSSFWNLF